MLVLKLKRGDVIRIGEAIIDVRKSTDGNLRLAIDAPKHIEIKHVQPSSIVRKFLTPEEALECRIEPDG